MNTYIIRIWPDRILTYKVHEETSNLLYVTPIGVRRHPFYSERRDSDNRLSWINDSADEVIVLDDTKFIIRR